MFKIRLDHQGTINTIISNLRNSISELDLMCNGEQLHYDFEGAILESFSNNMEIIDSDLAIDVLEQYAKDYPKSEAKNLATGIKVRLGY